MKRRYEYDDEMEEMEEGMDEECDCEDPDNCECDDEYDDGEEEDDDMEESTSYRAPRVKQLAESNALLEHANARSARYLLAYSALVNSALNESQQLAVIERLANPYDLTIAEWRDYLGTVINAYERGDRRDVVFEWHGGEAKRGAMPLHESMEHESPLTGDASLDGMILTMRRMQARGSGY